MALYATTYLSWVDPDGARHAVKAGSQVDPDDVRPALLEIWRLEKLVVDTEELEGGVGPVTLNDDATWDVTVTTSSAASYPAHTGGGWYELSDGSKVRGEDEAVEAQAELDADDGDGDGDDAGADEEG